METKETIFDSVTKTINAGGATLVSAFDTGAGFVKDTLSRLLAGETSQLTATVKEYRDKIHNLYVEIGKESVRFSDPAEAFAAAQVQALISQLREYEATVADTLQRLEEIAAEKIAARNARKTAKVEKEQQPIESNKENLLARALGRASARIAGEKAISDGAFKNMTDKEIFERVAHYLLNNETELRILLIKDLSRAGSKAALPSLIDALRDKDARIKIAVLAALSYIKDATAVDPIIQVLTDDNVDVRARALDSIKNITGVETEFDVHAEGEALKEWIALLKKCLETWVTTVTAAQAEEAVPVEASVEEDDSAAAGQEADAGEHAPEAEEDAGTEQESAVVEQHDDAASTHAEEPVVEEATAPDNGESSPGSAVQQENTAIWKRSRNRK